MTAFLPAPPPAALVGRDRELTILRARLAAARAGNGGLVLIGGEAGIGKTTLAGELCREAGEQGALLLIGRCYDLSETPPYGPWVDLFARSLTEESAAIPDAFARRGTVGAVTSQAMLFQQVLDFLSVLASRRAVVLLLDDLHWADPASLDLLRFLARSVTTLPIFLLVAYRLEEITRRHPLHALLPTLVREASPERLDLQPLDREAQHALLARRYHLGTADTARLIAYLQERTEGNPFFLGEILRTLEEGGTLHVTDDGWVVGDLRGVRIPLLLRQIIDGRLARLGEEARGLLAIAAVIGHEVPLALWMTVAECDEGALLALIERGLDARLLSEGSGDDRVRFAHALIRGALYEQIPGIRRRNVHRRVGEALAAARTPDPDAVAYHFQRAEDPRALPWLLKAGQRAQTAFAWVTATARFEAALALMAEAGESAMERGWLAARASRLIQFIDVARSRTLAEEAVALAEAADDRALAAFARVQRGLLAWFVGDVAHGLLEVQAGADGLAALSDAERAHFIAHAPRIGPASRLPDGRGTVVMWRSYIGPFPEVRALGERLVPEEAAGDEEVKQSLKEGIWGLAMAYAALGMPDEATAMFGIAHDASLRAEHHVVASLTMWLELELVALPYRAEEIAGRRRLAERSEAEWARASGGVPAAIPPRFVRLSLLILEGDWEAAERIAAAVSVEARGLIHFRMMALGHLATVTRLRGDAERAWSAVRECLPAGSATEPGTVWPFDVVTTVQRVAAALALDEGDLSHAKAWLDAHDRWLEWSGAVLGRAEGALAWAAYFRAAGEVATADLRASEAIAQATAPRQPLTLLAAHRLRGELATGAGRFDEAAVHLDRSLALADTCAAPFERALTLLARAELHTVTGDLTQAGALLDEVRVICAPLGAKPALARADALAARLAASRDAPPAYPAGLSAREVEVLRLVATGLTNAQVAERLFLSPHTINAHLTTIYAKLDVPSRAAAIRFALDHGLR